MISTTDTPTHNNPTIGLIYATQLHSNLERLPTSFLNYSSLQVTDWLNSIGYAQFATQFIGIQISVICNNN